MTSQASSEATKRREQGQRRLLDARRILGEGDGASNGTTRRAIPHQVKHLCGSARAGAAVLWARAPDDRNLGNPLWNRGFSAVALSVVDA